MKIRNVDAGAGRAVVGVLLALLFGGCVPGWATPLSSQARARDDDAILTMRSQGYAATKSRVMAGVAGSDAARVRDYQHFPLALWRISSIAALNRLEAYPGVQAVHQNSVLRPVSVSDLGFINQPQAAAAGATGAGTTIAVIDGGLGTNYLNFPDFGTCTAVNTPASTCRVVFNEDLYTGTLASTETTHGTNVSAIALGVALGAHLAMFDVFQGAGGDLAYIIDWSVARERVYGFKGRKLCRYEILFGAGKEKSELLGFLTRRNVHFLADGVLREVLRVEPPLTTARVREEMKPPAHSLPGGWPNNGCLDTESQKLVETNRLGGCRTRGRPNSAVRLPDADFHFPGRRSGLLVAALPRKIRHRCD
jgi:hypothetical protein